MKFIKLNVLLCSALVLLLSCNNSGNSGTDKGTTKADSSQSVPKFKDFGIDMVHVPGGAFNMGSNTGAEAEKPERPVTLSGYYIGKTEVTQKLWKDVMGTLPMDVTPCDSCPVYNISWQDAQDFITRLNTLSGKKYRMPTEAEWEFAARGGAAGKGTTYSGSDKLKEVGFYVDNAGGKLHNVAQLKANELGLYDMTGNVLEWVNDWFDPKYYAAGAQKDPQGPASGTERVNRGGSFRSTDVRSHVTFRFSDDPGVRSAGIGLRLAMSE